jgi:hypothetical protein
VAAFVRGEKAAALPAELDADQREVLMAAAMDGRLGEVVDALGPSFAGWHYDGTLLHHAAWYGNADGVRLLLERGADPHAETPADFETPAAWAALGSTFWRTPGHDYVAVLGLLLDAGATLEPRFLDVAQGPLAEWLADRVT